MERLALAINKALSVEMADGVLRPPGAGRGIRARESDEREIAILSHGDVLTLYFGRRSIVECKMSPKAARQLLGFLVRWWIFGTWCGLKLALWRWSLGVLVEAEQKRWKPKGQVRA